MKNFRSHKRLRKSEFF